MEKFPGAQFYEGLNFSDTVVVIASLYVETDLGISKGASTL